jgi:hypothetical protein
MRVTEQQETISALTRSVTALDASRRVGFGKAFTAQAKLDEALHDLNVARADRDIYRRSTSWLYGFIEQYVDNNSREETKQAVAAIIGDLSRVLDSVVLRKGRKDGLTAARWNPRRDIEASRAAKVESMQASEKMFRSARNAGEKRLAQRYGFANTAEFVHWLDEVRGRRV